MLLPCNRLYYVFACIGASSSNEVKGEPKHTSQILWLTGPQGAGKSTIGRGLQRRYPRLYVYYEGDVFLNGPGRDLDGVKREALASFASLHNLSDAGERQQRVNARMRGWQEMCNDVKREVSSRVKGSELVVKHTAGAVNSVIGSRHAETFVVDMYVPTVQERKKVVELLGDALITMVHLSLDDEELGKKRAIIRDITVKRLSRDVAEEVFAGIAQFHEKYDAVLDHQRVKEFVVDQSMFPNDLTDAFHQWFSRISWSARDEL